MTHNPMVKNHRLRLLTLLFASTLTVMAGAIVAPSLPQIASVFSHVEDVNVKAKLILTLPSLLIAIVAPFSGWIIDRFGRKKLLVWSLVLFAISGTSGLYLDDMNTILLGRLVLGMSVAGIFTSSTTLIADYYSGPERNKFMGLQGGFMAFGGLTYLSIGGILADINWRLPFSIYFVSALLILPAIFSLKETKGENNFSEDDPEYSTKPNPGLIAVLFPTVFISMTLFYMIPVQIPFLLSDSNGVNNFMIGISISGSSITGAIMSVNYNKIKNKLTFANIYTIAFLFTGLGFVLISQSREYWQVVAAIAISGFGNGLIFPNANVWAVSLTNKANRGRILGMLNFFLFGGLFISPIAIKPIENTFGLESSFLIGGIVLLFMSALYYFIIQRKLR